jgi:hypothetical protein
VTARYWSYGFGPEARARERLRALMEQARVHRVANGPPLSPWDKGELNVLTVFYPPAVREPNVVPDEFLARESIFSECLFDTEGFPTEYLCSVCAAPEGIQAPTSDAAAAQHDGPAPQPKPEPDAEGDFEEFVEVPRLSIDRELSAKEGRPILKPINDI